MKITLVGNRDGRASIHWPNVLLAAFCVFAMQAVAIVLMSVVLHWFSFVPVLLALAMVPIVLGVNIRRNLRVSPETLVRL
jgi:ABC-type Na+ efflux pump permease subunit